MSNRSITIGGQWRVLKACATGTSHYRTGRGCEDYCDWRTLPNGWWATAVADGAGSAQYAAKGSVHAVHAALSSVERLFSEGVEPEVKALTSALRTLVSDVRASLEDEAARFVPSTDVNTSEAAEVGESRSPRPVGAPLREFATTLLIAIITGRSLAVVHIGDGAVVVQERGGRLRTVTQPDHSEYINETCFITDTNYLDRVHTATIEIADALEGVALFTDGLQMLALDLATSQPYEPFFTPLFEFARQQQASEMELLEFLQSERVCARTDDDKTLVLAVRQ